MTTLDLSKGSRSALTREATGYVQPGRAGKTALVGYFDKEAHKAIKRLALDFDRTIEDLMAEAFHDLLLKLGHAAAAEKFKR